MAMFGVHRKGQCYSEPCYKGIPLQSNYRKMTILWSFSCNYFVKFHGKKIWEPQHDHVTGISKSQFIEVCNKETALCSLHSKPEMGC